MIWHVFNITVKACLFYTIYSLIMFFLGKDVDWGINICGVFNWFIFNKPSWGGVPSQYWFLFALLYTYLFYWFVIKLGVLRQAYWLAGVMFLVYMILAQGMHLGGVAIPNWIYRNWLVEGFAFFMLGHWIHQNQSKLHFKNKYLLSIVFVSTMFCIPERYVMGRDFGVNIFSIPQVFCIFLYAVNNPLKHKGGIQEIGKRYSMFVYIIHPAVWHTLEYVYSKAGIENNLMASYCMPIFVVAITLLCSHLVYILNLKFKVQKS